MGEGTDEPVTGRVASPHVSCKAGGGQGASSGTNYGQPRRNGAPKAKSEDAHQGDQRADCYGATPTGDGERVFVTAQRRRADSAL